MTSIQELTDYIDQHWVWDGKSYPLLNVLTTDEDRKHFQKQHILHHLQKQVGGLADLIEDAEHGIKIDPVKERALISKLLLNTLEMMHVSGLNEQSAVDWIKELYQGVRGPSQTSASL